MYSPCDEGITSSVFASVFFGSTTSADEATAHIAQLQLFPNPSTGLVNVSYTLREVAPAKISVYDVAGRLLQTFDADDLRAVQNQVFLDLRALPGGIYVVELQSLGARETKLLAKTE